MKKANLPMSLTKIINLVVVIGLSSCGPFLKDYDKDVTMNLNIKNSTDQEISVRVSTYADSNERGNTKIEYLVDAHGDFTTQHNWGCHTYQGVSNINDLNLMVVDNDTAKCIAVFHRNGQRDCHDETVSVVCAGETCVIEGRMLDTGSCDIYRIEEDFTRHTPSKEPPPTASRWQ